MGLKNTLSQVWLLDDRVSPAQDGKGLSVVQPDRIQGVNEIASPKRGADFKDSEAVQRLVGVAVLAAALHDDGIVVASRR
jgi:hypothetical protein